MTLISSNSKFDSLQSGTATFTPSELDGLTIFNFFQGEGGLRDYKVTGVQTCALPIYHGGPYSAHAATAFRAHHLAVGERQRPDRSGPGCRHLVADQQEALDQFVFGVYGGIGLRGLRHLPMAGGWLRLQTRRE